MEVYEWEGLNLSFFLKDNSNDFLAGFHAFKGESNLIDNMLVTGNFTTDIDTAFPQGQRLAPALPPAAD